MIKSFISESTKAVVDYKKNRFFLLPQMEELFLDITDDKGVFLSLESFIMTATSVGAEQWDKHEWIRLIVGGIQCAGGYPRDSELMNTAISHLFLYGMMFERLRNKRGLTIKVHRRQMTSEEMDLVIKEASQPAAKEGEDDDE
jgi:hypothetical protein